MCVGPFLLVQAPVVVLSASIAVWFFYAQHQFEGTHWAHDGDWTFHDAALNETSHYAQPSPHFSDEREGLRQRFILSYEFSEAGDEWPQAGLGHVGYQLVEHAALPEQRMGSAFGGVDLEMTIHA